MKKLIKRLIILFIAVVIVGTIATVALYIAKSLGLDSRGVIADNSTAASTLKQSIREYPARMKAFLQCKILHSKPIYLGKSIPISGSGIVTEG